MFVPKNLDPFTTLNQKGWKILFLPTTMVNNQKDCRKRKTNYNKHFLYYCKYLQSPARWCSQKICLGGAQNRRILWVEFSDVITTTSLKWRHNGFLKLDFVVISLKNHNLANSSSLDHQNQRLKGAWGVESLQRLAILKNLLLK